MFVNSSVTIKSLRYLNLEKTAMKMSESKFNKEVFPNFDDDSVKK